MFITVIIKPLCAYIDLMLFISWMVVEIFWLLRYLFDLNIILLDIVLKRYVADLHDVSTKREIAVLLSNLGR